MNGRTLIEDRAVIEGDFIPSKAILRNNSIYLFFTKYTGGADLHPGYAVLDLNGSVISGPHILFEDGYWILQNAVLDHRDEIYMYVIKEKYPYEEHYIMKILPGGETELERIKTVHILEANGESIREIDFNSLDPEILNMDGIIILNDSGAFIPLSEDVFTDERNNIYSITPENFTLVFSSFLQDGSIAVNEKTLVNYMQGYSIVMDQNHIFHIALPFRYSGRESILYVCVDTNGNITLERHVFTDHLSRKNRYLDDDRITEVAIDVGHDGSIFIAGIHMDSYYISSYGGYRYQYSLVFTRLDNNGNIAVKPMIVTSPEDARYS